MELQRQMLGVAVALVWALVLGQAHGFTELHPKLHHGGGESVPCLRYHNWCGLAHGGFDDCCGGQACPSCNSSATQPTAECLIECPPADELDHACAMHDSCISNHRQPEDLPCSSFVNCPCDCALVKRLNEVRCDAAKSPIECDVCRDFYTWLEGSFAYCWIDKPERQCLPVHRFCNLTFVDDTDVAPAAAVVS